MASKLRFPFNLFKSGWRRGEYAYYQKRVSHIPFDLRKHFMNLSYVAVDCEMTGLNPHTDEIISIGAVYISKGQIDLSGRFYRVIRPEQPRKKTNATLIHQLSGLELEKGGRLENVLKDFKSYLGDRMLIGHFLRIDIDFLQWSLSKTGMAPIENLAFDTNSLYTWYLGKYDEEKVQCASRQLEDIALDLNIPMSTPHNAFYDALAAAQIFLKLGSLFRKEVGQEIEELYRESGIRL